MPSDQIRVPESRPEPKFQMGQIVIAKSTKKELPFRVLEICWRDGCWFYAWNSKNFLAESSIRALTLHESGPAQLEEESRQLREEVGRLQGELARPWEHSEHWRNPETGQVECDCCCNWALDAERDHKEIAALKAEVTRLNIDHCEETRVLNDDLDIKQAEIAHLQADGDALRDALLVKLEGLTCADGELRALRYVVTERVRKSEAEIDTLKAEVERLKKPVTDEEWGLWANAIDGETALMLDEPYLTRELTDALIAARATSVENPT